MRPEWEPVRGFVPHVVKPPASTRRTPRRYFPGLASCCKLGSGLLGIWVMGKIIVSIYLFALSVSNSKNDLGSTETSSFDGTEDPDLNSTTDLLTTSTPFLQIVEAPQIYNDSSLVDQEIKDLAKNYSYKNNDSASAKILVTLLKNDSITLGTAINALQNLETGVESRNKRSAALSQLAQDMRKLGFEVKKGLKYLFIKIGGRWWQPGTYRGPQVYKPTDAPLPYTGEYDLDFVRWVTKDGYRVRYLSLPFSERLARSRPPWCVLSEEQKWEVRSQVVRFFRLRTDMQNYCPKPWDCFFRTPEERINWLTTAIKTGSQTYTYIKQT